LTNQAGEHLGDLGESAHNRVDEGAGEVSGAFRPNPQTGIGLCFPRWVLQT
jgi:hypothetical protein